MSEQQQISVQRKRGRCPYCHEEILAGAVWICPGCEATQHSECKDEHQGCAACEWKPASTDQASHKAEGRALPPELASRKAELQRQGFAILAEGPERVTAGLGRWYWDCGMTKLVYTVFVRRVPVLDETTYFADRVKLEEEAASLDTSALPRGFQKGNAVVVLYLADRVDPEVIERIEHKPERGFAKFHFPVALDLSTGHGAYLQSTPMWGALYYAKFRHLAERLLRPEAPPTKEPLSRAGVAMAILLVASCVISLLALAAVSSL